MNQWDVCAFEGVCALNYLGFGKLPWDMVVFLTITSVGLGVSFKRLAIPRGIDTQTTFEVSEDALPLTGGQASHGIVDLGCLDRRSGNERLNFDGDQIRFKGKFCNLTRYQMHFFDGMRVKNTANGLEGPVFFHGNGTEFVSDLIPLAVGKNSVQIEWREAKGKQPRVVTAEIFEK